ncbi:hypothetical protein PHLCEN_2v3482 [Hermanssonia centrifuga]|uniref:Pentatricopeptide repeat-containing protein-mitochondrial domain-containing protein n=1 Tax=Hermanssonia centrifuga TaxID=98765 RepID=A0A2R6QEZ0_9APHY|nr:hypothetical protein PHLCEN_2v3482 [Hermanssonia centrifuga]
MQALRYTPIEETQAQIDLMHTYSIRPNETTYELLIDRLVHAGHLETAIQTLAHMGNEGIAPTLNAAQAVIKLACDLHFPRLALDLAQAFESTSVRRIDPGIWACILVSSSESLYEKGVLTAWKKTVHDFGLTPDEGCCINVLHTVGRYGLAALGLDVILVLRRMNILWREHHFAPVIEALCVVGNIEEAFGMLELMRDCDIVPVQETAYPIFQAIRTDVDKLDEAWGILETMREQGRKVDIVALNTIIQASVALGDLQRALGTYRAAGDLGITPTVDTFNLLLSACIAVSHRELGDRLLAEMRAASIRPDLRTYERLVVLCLTQPTYEDAFFYLEDMKSAGIKPTQNIYDALIRRCVSAGDTRYNLAVEEMLEQGYDMPEKLQNFIASGGERDTPQYPAGEDRPRGRQRRPRSEDETPKEILELIPPLSKN